MQDKDALGTLNWLIEAGADEAVGETPVNRLTAVEAAPPKPAIPKSAFAPPAAKKAVSPPPLSNDAIGDAMALAAAATSLADNLQSCLARCSPRSQLPRSWSSTPKVCLGPLLRFQPHRTNMASERSPSVILSLVYICYNARQYGLIFKLLLLQDEVNILPRDSLAEIMAADEVIAAKNKFNAVATLSGCAASFEGLKSQNKGTIPSSFHLTCGSYAHLTRLF